MSESAAPTLKAARKPSASWMNVRALLRGPQLRQSPQALKAASRMVLFLPLLQTALLVGVLNSELWLGLLGLEGLLMGALASSQLSQRDAQYRLLGLGMAFVNTLALAGFGLFVGSHAFWISGVIGFLPAMALVLLPTGPRTVKASWAAYIFAFALLFGGAGFARFCVETAGDDDVASRRMKLEFAWAAFVVRGGNGTERALLRLRMAQAAFAENEFEAAFAYADDGLRYKDGRWRDLPATALAEPLFQAQLNVKPRPSTTLHGTSAILRAPIKPEPLDTSTLSECRVKWGF